MKKVKEKLLTNVPSKLIRLALKELDKVEKEGVYQVAMDDSWWLYYETKEGFCSVCFAGALMLSLPYSKYLFKHAVDNFPPDNRAKIYVANPSNYRNEYCFRALDAFRVGALKFGFTYLGITYGYDYLYDVKITSYDLNPELFKVDMELLARTLEELGY